MDPRSAPGGPRSGPRGPKTAPRAARSAPRAAQEAQKRSKKGHHLRLGSRGGLRRPPGAILVRFWSLPGTILELFFKAFRSKLGRKARRETGGKRAKRSQLSGAGRAAAEHPPPGEKPIANARNAPSSKRPAQAAQRPSKGIERSTPLAILMLALLSPRLLCCSSCPCALVSLAVLASLLVFCAACNACGSRVERASRSMLARFYF